MTGYLFEDASAAKCAARMSRLLLDLLVRFSVPKQLFAPCKTMADSPTDIDGVFAFKRQNVAKERFYSVVHLPPPASPVRFLSLAATENGRAHVVDAPRDFSPCFLDRFPGVSPSIVGKQQRRKNIDGYCITYTSVTCVVRSSG
jgi:hypothetical protein